MSWRPQRFLSARWQHLAMLNYEIDPGCLRRWVPSGTELDAWNGKTLVSMVGFLFLDTRLMGIPVPYHRDFEEVNLRFYVRRKAADKWLRGVVFVKEIVPRWAIARVAQISHGEKYISTDMRHAIETAGGSTSFRYEWSHRGEWDSLALRTTGTPALPLPGSQEEFITEHYWGYATQRGGRVLEYKVAHPQWRVWQGVEPELHCRAVELYGPEFAESLSQAPASAFLAEGSAVTVDWGLPLA
ncbi:MAG TPA: DUF2071 domain-containing protein [Candidatus Limnocylindria bacterium]|nr:DUF2071 domain-containing protein [Candidatus Limnocylindria bacterium]